MQIELQSTRVYIGNVSNGYISAEFARSLLDLVITDKNNKWEFFRGVLWGRSGVNITDKRNEIVRQFLKTDGEWLLMIDSDMVFSEDLIPRLLHSAKQANCMVVGGLCVVVDEGMGPYPTLFHLDPESDRFLSAQLDYPPDALLEVSATGAACLLVHRQVLQSVLNAERENRKWLTAQRSHQLVEEMDARGLISVPSEDHGWFSEYPISMSVAQKDGSYITKERWVGEDISFCLKLKALGYQIFVDCSVEIGHHKEDRIWYPKDIKEGVGFRRPPIAVVIPVKDKLHLTKDLVEQIREDKFTEIIICDNGSQQDTKDWLAEQDDITVLDCPEIGIHHMWNKAVDHALEKHGHKVHVAILNNDIKMGAGFLDKLSLSLFRNSELVAVCGNYDDRVFDAEVQEVHDICAARYDGTGGFAGFAFMVRGEWFASGYRFPEECMWWYGDNDLITSIEIGNVVTKDIPRKAAIVLNAYVEHLDGGGQTSGDPLWSAFSEQLEKDRIAYEKIHEQHMQRLQTAQQATQVHTCAPSTVETISGYMDRISADRLSFIADIEASVKAFPRQWANIAKVRVKDGEEYNFPSMVKISEDIERYHEIIAKTQAEIVIECGTWQGGSAEWLASLGLEVVTIDVENHVDPERKIKNGENIHWLYGSSVDADIVATVKEYVGDKKCMVILDSDHHTCHVLAEMEIYGQLVSDDCYMVVEDGLVRWIPVDEHRSLINHGPMQAIEAYLSRHKEFERDKNTETMFPVTMHPAGFLRKT